MRFDHVLNSKVSFFARVAYAPSSASTRSTTFIGQLDTIHQYNYTFTAGSTQTITPHGLQATNFFPHSRAAINFNQLW